MNDTAINTATKPPKWFWLVSALGLAWNLLGLAAFFVQMTMDLSEVPEPSRS